MRLATTLRSRHLKAALALLVLGFVASTALVGDLAWGPRGAVAAPIVSLLLGIVALHLFVRLAVIYGLRAHGRGDHGRAFATLWVTQVRWFRAYDRKGKVSSAFDVSKGQLMGNLLRNQMQSMFQQQLR